MVSPMGAVLWAMVSDEVDQRISSQLDKPLKLQQSEWRSGEIPWIVAAFGDPKVVGQLLEELSKNVFKQRPAKLRSRGEDGKAFVGKLEFKPAQTS
jgi:hemolysin-activating ACP:hemolysin acyltransferase